MDHAGAEAVLEDAVGLLEAPLDVADHDARAIAHVAVAVEDRDRRVALPRLVHQRRPRRERRLEVEHRGQRLVDHLDRGQGRLGRLGRGRRHGRHRLPHVAHFPGGEDRLVLEAAAVAHLGHVGGADDRAHAGERARAPHVEAHDARVRLGAPEDLADEHAGQRKVRRIHGRARHLARRIEPRERLADDVQLPGRHPRHLPAATTRPAATTASAIFWYPVQRQRFPASISRTSASVALGRSSRNAFADRIMPGMQ